MFEDEHVNDVVVVLRNPVLSNRDLRYDIEVTDGELSSTSGPASLFIDRLGRPLTPMIVRRIFILRPGGPRGRRDAATVDRTDVRSARGRDWPTQRENRLVLGTFGPTRRQMTCDPMTGMPTTTDPVDRGQR